LSGGPSDGPKKRQYPAIVLYLLLIAVAFIAGIILFDLVIMPRVVGRGNVSSAPAIEGMSLKQAQEICLRGRLEVSVAGSRSSDEIPAGYIISQNPRQGQSLKQGRAIKVIVSSGRKMEIVPSFQGKTLRETELLVESSGLARGRTVRIFAPGEGQPSVLATSPSAGTKVPRGSPVDILVGIHGEPKSYLMPNLVGRDFPFVKDRLERLGFNVVHAAATNPGDARFPHAILSQTPPAGAKIKEGDTIELIVSAVE
jgi:beta-lactam-binding protein with PASTA domain